MTETDPVWALRNQSRDHPPDGDDAPPSFQFAGKRAVSDQVKSSTYQVSFCNYRENLKFRTVLMLSHHLPCRKRTFVLPLKRSEVADYLGLTIETVSRKLSWLKVHNVIEGITEGRSTIEVCDPARLGGLSGSYGR